MIAIDTLLLDLTESFCRWFQRMTGRTNVWLAVQLTNLSIIVYFVYAAVYFWTIDLGPRIALGLFCGGLVYLLTQTILRVPIETYENAAFRRVARGFRNPRRVRDFLLRISFLTLSLFLLYPVVLVYTTLHIHVVALSYSLIVLTTVMLYLLACDPLPPCPAKVSEWWRALVPSRLVTTESPVRSHAASTSLHRWITSNIATSHIRRHGHRHIVRSLQTSPPRYVAHRHVAESHL